MCIFSHYVNAQLKDTFEKGAIITKENEKIDGYIKTDDLSHLSLEVCFRLNEHDEKDVCYNTSQIKSFQTVTGKTFDLLSIKINNNRTEITVFANLILKGNTSLYKTSYNSKVFYVVVSNGQNYVLENDELDFSEIKKYNYQGVLNIATEGFFMENYPKIAFNEKDFIKVISQYNASKGYECKEIKYDEKNIHYSILNVGGGGNKYMSEFFLQAIYRLYNPKISRSTSLNLGLNFYQHQIYKLPISVESGVRKSLISIPFQLQQNLLNKDFRPYLFAGLNLSYVRIVDDKNNSLIDSGLQRNFGVGFLYGAGIEVDLYKGFMLKTEFRNELFTHLILFGIGYNFSK